MTGWKKGLEVWPAALVCGGSFAVTQWWSSNFLGPLLPDILASIASIVCLVLFLRIWHPKESWHFPEEGASKGREALRYSGGQVFRAWAPFIILSIFVAAWGIKPVKEALDYMATFKLQISGLHNLVIRADKPMSAIFTMNILSAAGTAILFAGLFSIPVMGASLSAAGQVGVQTLKTLKWPVVTISFILGFAYIMNFSGMAITLGNAFASTGVFFPFFSPFLGWMGVFMTGSDTSTNALFGKLQEVTATKIGVDPVITVSANTSGGVCGKMISPQSLAVATAAVGLVGKESDIFRFTLKHSLILTFVIAIITVLQAYVITWIVPVYTKSASVAAVASAAAASPFPTAGFGYLVITVIIVSTVTVMSRIMGNPEAV
jgi:lactate permease